MKVVVHKIQSYFEIPTVKIMNYICLSTDVNAEVVLHFVLMTPTRLFAVQVEPGIFLAVSPV
jgi:hypothetical protein